MPWIGQAIDSLESKKTFKTKIMFEMHKVIDENTHGWAMKEEANLSRKQNRKWEMEYAY